MMQIQRRSGSMSSLCLDHPKAKLLLAAVCGLFVAAPMACGQSGRLASGEEPPIRVRNGSVEMQLVHKNGEWEPQSAGDRKNWKVKGEPERGKPEYEVIVVPTDRGNCMGPLVLTADGVKITTKNGGATNSIDIKLTNKKTKIKSGNVDLASSADVLSEAGSAFISKIEVGNSLVCEFGSPDPGLRVVLMDP